MQKKTLTYEAGKAYLETVDRLYIIASQTGMSEDWVMMTAKSIQDEIEKETGIDLGRA